jgi:hypothetical protein
MLALAVPVIVATNPVDPTWLPGLYDDADSDQLVSQALSPESWLGAAIPIILCVLSTIALAWSRRLGWRRADRTEQVARAPPGLAAASTRVVSADLRSAERAPLAHLTVRLSSSLRRLRRASTSGIDTACIEEGENGAPASILRSSLSGTTRPSRNQMRLNIPGPFSSGTAHGFAEAGFGVLSALASASAATLIGDPAQYVNDSHQVFARGFGSAQFTNTITRHSRSDSVVEVMLGAAIQSDVVSSEYNLSYGCSPRNIGRLGNTEPVANLFLLGFPSGSETLGGDVWSPRHRPFVCLQTTVPSCRDPHYV